MDEESGGDDVFGGELLFDSELMDFDSELLLDRILGCLHYEMLRAWFIWYSLSIFRARAYVLKSEKLIM